MNYSFSLQQEIFRRDVLRIVKPSIPGHIPEKEKRKCEHCKQTYDSVACPTGHWCCLPCGICGTENKESTWFRIPIKKDPSHVIGMLYAPWYCECVDVWMKTALIGEIVRHMQYPLVNGGTKVLDDIKKFLAKHFEKKEYLLRLKGEILRWNRIGKSAYGPDIFQDVLSIINVKLSE